MEMKIDEKLSVMELLKRAVKLIFSNINHAFFLFLCSLPLFCFLIFSELSLQTTISLAYQFPCHKLNLGGYFLFQDQINLPENDLITWLIQTSLLYFFPYSLIDLFTTTMIVAASSTSEEKPLGMLSLVRRSAKICQNRLVGCLITSLYVLLLSTSVFFGFFSDSVNFLFIASLTRQSFYKLFYTVVILIHGTIFIVLTAKFIKWRLWSARWNMGLVVSLFEEEDGKGIYGTNAMSHSYWYGRGHEKRDLWIGMLTTGF
ncbi:hypothetical protein F2Q68_00033934 [Brassica cretica]|uniref:Uncharacterized protein n=1 Tax=Brassica cretica TaxID=69181 RepID=A0A8S9GW87_BRACR|nr:hypothetical protein F2Q68_00033934 [Brassica cretica]